MSTKFQNSTECKNQDYLATIWKATITANLLYSYVLAEGGYVVAIKDLLTANIFESGPMPTRWKFFKFQVVN